MMSLRYHSSPPPACVHPRQQPDTSQRLKTYGPIQPMDWPERRLTLMECAISLAGAIVLAAIGAAVVFHV